jgi:hypothetical protein
MFLPLLIFGIEFGAIAFINLTKTKNSKTSGQIIHTCKVFVHLLIDYKHYPFLHSYRIVLRSFRLSIVKLHELVWHHILIESIQQNRNEEVQFILPTFSIISWANPTFEVRVLGFIFFFSNVDKSVYWSFFCQKI